MRVLERTAGPAPIDPAAAAQALLAAGGLDGWPGPALLLHRDGTVPEANAASAVLLHPAPDPALVAAVVQGVATTVTVRLGAGPALQAFECTVLPLSPGRSALVLARDVTLDARLRAALVDSRQRYKDLVEVSGDFCWETGPDGRFVFVSPRGAVGWRAEDLVGREPADLLADGAAAAPLPFQARHRTDDVDVWVRRGDGGEACLAVTALPLYGRDGSWIGARGLCRDVSAARARDAAIARSAMRERLHAHVARAVRDEIEPARMIAAAARAVARALAAAECRIVAMDGAALSAGRTGADAELVAAAADQGRPMEALSGDRRVLAVATVFRGVTNGAVVIERSAAEPPWSEDERVLAGDLAVQIGIALAQIERERRLEALTRTDGLTGLLNRRAFDAELGARLARGVPSSAPGALIFVDLDNFKAVNDVHGHARGDEALCAVAQMLQRSTRPGDLVARPGGDEFALWLERTDESAVARRAADLAMAAERLAAFSGSAAQPFGLSIGAAVFAPGSGETPAALAKRADGALYAVKRNGKSGYAVAPPITAESAAAR